MNDPRKFKAPYYPKERIWQEADRLRATHPPGCELPIKILDLAEFDLHLDLVPVNGLREQLDIDALLMGDLKSILVDKHAFMSPRMEYRLRFSVAHEIDHLLRRIATHCIAHLSLSSLISSAHAAGPSISRTRLA